MATPPNIETTPVSSQAEYYDLGSYSRAVSTENQDARAWFIRGLIWSYAFNHEEAVKCFEQVVAHDPGCAIGFWGIAYALGPNYNKPWEFFDRQELKTVVQRTHRAVEQGRASSASASPVEQALVEALESRYPGDAAAAKDSPIWNQDYADAMRSVYCRFPEDADVTALFADALLNLTPWQLWDLDSGEPAPDARTMEAKEVLEKALALDSGREHPGLLHLYIHLMEMSPTPEAALTTADRLRELVPDAGHLQHMPSHLDILVGDYRRAVAANQAAVRADERFLARAGPLNFYTLYRMHDYHFCMYAAMFSGQSAIALDAASRIEASLPETLLRVASPPMADWLEGFASARVHVLIRFGHWSELTTLEPPKDRDLYCVTTAMVYYGRGVAFAAMGKLEEARSERERFAEALRMVPESRTLFNNKCRDILGVAEAMLDGEIAYRSAVLPSGSDDGERPRDGGVEAAYAHLREAVRRDDDLPYDEPWGWMQPTRHALGALLLEQGFVAAAAKVYAADLGLDAGDGGQDGSKGGGAATSATATTSLPRARQHPNNVWALHGYHECLIRLQRHAEARLLWPQLRLALAVADVSVTSSCFCRLSVIAEGEVEEEVGCEATDGAACH